MTEAAKNDHLEPEAPAETQTAAPADNTQVAALQADLTETKD